MGLLGARHVVPAAEGRGTADTRTLLSLAFLNKSLIFACLSYDLESKAGVPQGRKWS